MKSLKELSLRIKNIKSVQKSTKMMHMVSASKLLQSQKQLITSRLFLSHLHLTITLLMSRIKETSLEGLMIQETKSDCNLIFIIASDRGLCGNFNSSIIKYSIDAMNFSSEHDIKTEIVFIGKKAFDIGKNLFYNNSILQVENSQGITLKRIYAIVNSLTISRYNEIKIYYNKYYNIFKHHANTEIIKPWSTSSSLTHDVLLDTLSDARYIYEPNNIEYILQSIMQEYIPLALYSAILESITSEHSARMIAMESANKNTKDMLNRLALLYNRSRQAKITNDLIEVLGGTTTL
ncbi:ATP synthase F1 subunit gamma [Wolbachia endosymbiont of Howardula sp.]|uniref:ATP synthase F1 subunit gamma n=1 Tax=Wolbachia endosymbiont of Howardula sp. TaxID=2916816 RepID=UPI00217CE6EF|nr:ATP synthase F1 subunit gamma [Wolbachia endosymbiont of Howardula sp.]UWI83029.1 ATP synthase F1 subunit gamma [Wolbachia endosymbiont of Howardula sp.]